MILKDWEARDVPLFFQWRIDMRALVVDDEPNIRKVLKRLLLEQMPVVDTVSTVLEALEAAKTNVYDLAIVDMRLHDGSGIDVLRALKEERPATVVLMVTAFASAETAIEAMKAGALDYMTKPFNIEEIRMVVRNVVERLQLESKVRSLQQYADEYQSLIGKSDAMRRVFAVIDKIAPFDSNVLIIGESGTGKELVAKAIHEKSRRGAEPMIAINCASLPGELLESELFGYAKGAFTGAYTTKRGLIEEAHGGTLFLDEIGEMPLGLQAKLLRFLEDKKIRPLGSGVERNVDVRVIAATNRLVTELLAKGDFREDLFYRLATFELTLPSLRERREDIPLLVNHFVKFFAQKFEKRIERIDPGFMDFIVHHELRGNVRELKNLIEREVILSEGGVLRRTGAQEKHVAGEIVSDIPPSGFSLDEYLASIERSYLNRALKMTNGNKTKAAEMLGLTFREFRYRLAKQKASEV